MGGRAGPTAATRLTLWACLNYQFSPKLVGDTRDKFREFLHKEGIGVDQAILDGRFYDFAIHLGCVPGDDDVIKASELGWRTFEPGTIEFLSLVTFQNLDGGKYRARLSWESPSHPEQETPQDVYGNELGGTVHKDKLTQLYPRPMSFHRVYGATEELTVASTKYGLRVTITSMAPESVNERTAKRFEHGVDLGFSGD
jgi:hypothetical protein